MFPDLDTRKMPTSNPVVLAEAGLVPRPNLHVLILRPDPDLHQDLGKARGVLVHHAHILPHLLVGRKMKKLKLKVMTSPTLHPQKMSANQATSPTQLSRK